jgi:phage/plasmid-associated DNA primase
MTAVPLFDILAHSQGSDADGPRLAQLAEKLVESALADWQRVLDYEQQFSSAELATPALESQFNQSIYRIYQEWAADAEQILQRTRSLAARGYPVENGRALEDAHGRVGARLKLTPQMLARATEQVRRGETTPIEELRNELRSRVRS